MNFELEFSKKATKQIKDLKKSDAQGYKKVIILLNEIIENPEFGVGEPERLKGNLSGYWSRRINKKDRLIYRINNEEVYVYIISAKGHYGDK